MRKPVEFQKIYKFAALWRATLALYGFSPVG